MKKGKKRPISNIKKLRLELSLTQSEIANGSGLDIKTYRSVEKGTAQPRIDTLQALYSFFNSRGLSVSMDYLLGLSDFRSPENDFIGKNTGLSDTALNQLKILKRDKISINTLNYILEQDDSIHLFTNIHSYLFNNFTVPKYYDAFSDSFRVMEYPDEFPLSDCFFVGIPDSEGVNPISINIIYTHLINCIRDTLNKWRDNKKTFGEDTFTSIVTRATSHRSKKGSGS